jgi:hypothetical protein
LVTVQGCLPPLNRVVRPQSQNINCDKAEDFLMSKFLRGITTIERTFQILALLGLFLFLGYIGLNSFRRDRVPSVPSSSPATQLK